MRTFIFVIAMMTGIVTTSFAQVKSALLTASGLTCSMCSKSIFKSLEKVSFVESVDVDLNTSVFKIKFKDGANVDPDALKDAVTGAGFAVATLQLVADFPETHLGKDTHLNLAGATYHIINADGQHISGEKTVTITDKNFVTASEYKKYKKQEQMKCYETGKAGSCCGANVTAGTRIYHLSL